MSEVPTEKVYLRTVLGAVFLVDSLGRILGRQHSFEVSGAHSSFIEARITVEPDGSWSPEVAKEYIGSVGLQASKNGVTTDVFFDYGQRFGLQDFKVINGQDGIEMEIECMHNPHFVMVNGKKYLPDGARGDNGKPDQVEPIESTELNSDRRASEPVLTEVENILCVDTEIPVDSALINGEKFVRDQPSKLAVSDFNRILEYFPDAAGALIERRGVTVGEFRELVRSGKITFEEAGLSIARCAEPSKKQESKLSVEVDTSAVEASIKRIEDAQKAFWKSHVAPGSVSIAGEVAAFEPFPICPLESAISETVRHLREDREEFHRFKKDGIDVGDGLTERLGQHLESLLREQYKRLSK